MGVGHVGPVGHVGQVGPVGPYIVKILLGSIRYYIIIHLLAECNYDCILVVLIASSKNGRLEVT